MNATRVIWLLFLSKWICVHAQVIPFFPGQIEDTQQNVTATVEDVQEAYRSGTAVSQEVVNDRESRTKSPNGIVKSVRTGFLTLITHLGKAVWSTTLTPINNCLHIGLAWLNQTFRSVVPSPIHAIEDKSYDVDMSFYLPQTAYVAAVLAQMQKEADEGFLCSDAKEICASKQHDKQYDVIKCIQRICDNQIYRECKTKEIVQCESALHSYFDLLIFEACEMNDMDCINELILKCSNEIGSKCYPDLFSNECSRAIMHQAHA